MRKELDFESEFLRRQPKRKQIVRFMREAMGVEHVTWDMLTKVNLIDVADHIKGTCSPNSAKTYFAIISAFLKLYQEEGIVPCRHPEEVLKCKKVPQQSVCLTEEEVACIQAYYDNLVNSGGSRCVVDVLTMFLIECYTGARYSDVCRLTMNNITDGTLSYVSQKTFTLTELPVHSRLRELIGRIPKQKYYQMTVNRILKRVAKECGINTPTTLFYHGAQRTMPKYEYISSHSGRKSFCTALARRGVDIYTIAALAGHGQNITMTQRYIISDTARVSQQAMAFFQN